MSLHSSLVRVGLLGVAALATVPLGAQEEPEAAPAPGKAIDGVSFALERRSLYVPVREAAETLEWPVHWDARQKAMYLNNRTVSPSSTRRLLDGTLLMHVRAVSRHGGKAEWDGTSDTALLSDDTTEVQVRKAPKRVAVNRAAQRLRAWQGERKVLETRVSTGKRGHETPRGEFRAGPYRSRMHYSSLYENAPMPWSVQIDGHVFFHGFGSVPRRAASHGCIRLPLTRGNPARWLYEWIDNGTPVAIADGWPADED
jgi:lipoprotein-anchoring transpeptidase ErfK/SrfK